MSRELNLSKRSHLVVYHVGDLSIVCVAKAMADGSYLAPDLRPRNRGTTYKRVEIVQSVSNLQILSFFSSVVSLCTCVLEPQSVYEGNVLRSWQTTLPGRAEGQTCLAIHVDAHSPANLRCPNKERDGFRSDGKTEECQQPTAEP